MIPRLAARCAARRLIDRHFAARIRPAEELALRAHLPDCARCRRYYEAHMLYAELAPARPALSERLAAGLGVAAAPTAPASGWLPSRRTWLVTSAAAAACLALLGTGQGVHRTERDFGVRGLAADGTGPALEIYRVTGDGATKPAEGWMAAGDELAFAYRNPTGFTRLMVFGVDDRGDIFWFHPGWTDANQNPVAVPINVGVGPFELPEAIQHQVQGSRLRVVALFTNTADSVRSLEETWRQHRQHRQGPQGPIDRRDPPGSVVIEAWLEVRP